MKLKRIKNWNLNFSKVEKWKLKMNKLINFLKFNLHENCVNIVESYFSWLNFNDEKILQILFVFIKQILWHFQTSNDKKKTFFPIHLTLHSLFLSLCNIFPAFKHSGIGMGIRFPYEALKPQQQKKLLHEHSLTIIVVLYLTGNQYFLVNCDDNNVLDGWREKCTFCPVNTLCERRIGWDEWKSK